MHAYRQPLHTVRDGCWWCVAVCTMHECTRVVASSERHFCDLFCYYYIVTNFFTHSYERWCTLEEKM